MNTAKKIIPWAVFVLISVGLLAWIFLSKKVTEEEIANYDTKIGEAVLHEESMEYSTAMEAYYDAAKIIPDRIYAYEGIVKILLEKNRVDDAIEIIEKTAREVSNKEKSVLYGYVGNYYYAVKSYDEALEIFEKAEDLSENQKVNLGYAKTYLQKGDMNKAIKLLENNVYEGDLLSESQLLLSYIYSLDDIEKAKETILNTDSTESFSIYFEEMSNILAGLSQDTKFNSAKLARIFVNNGYPYLAIQALEPERDNISEYVEALYFLGRAYYEYGDMNEALTVLDQAALVGGLEIEIFWTEARVYFALNDLEKSFQMYERAVAYSGEIIGSDLAIEYIDLLVENNQYLNAEEYLKKFVNYTEDPWITILSISSYYKMEEFEKVDFYIEEAEKLELTDSEKEELLYWKATREIEKDNLSGAKISISELYDLNKYSSFYYYLLGRIEFAEGNSEQAIDALERSLEYDLDYEITEEASKLLSRIQ